MTGTALTAPLLLLCLSAGASAQNSGETNNDGECSAEWGYGPNNGPETWGDICPACNGERQSPINIDTSLVEFRQLSGVRGSFYDNRYVPFNYTIRNDNYTVTVILDSLEPLIKEGGPLPGRFVVHCLQFCWGSNSSLGSEHTIDGERYPMEAIWVLFNEMYGSYENALGKPNGLFIISLLFPLEEQGNIAVSNVVANLPKVTQPGAVAASSEPLVYNSLFDGTGPNDYYAYNGSLTTPPCTEDVTWFIYTPVHGVSEDQVSEFRKIMSNDGVLVNNFRPLQPLNDRVVVASTKSSMWQTKCSQESAAKSHRASRHHHY